MNDANAEQTAVDGSAYMPLFTCEFCEYPLCDKCVRFNCFGNVCEKCDIAYKSGEIDEYGCDHRMAERIYQDCIVEGRPFADPSDEIPEKCECESVE